MGPSPHKPDEALNGPLLLRTHLQPSRPSHGGKWRSIEDCIPLLRSGRRFRKCARWHLTLCGFGYWARTPGHSSRQRVLGYIDPEYFGLAGVRVRGNLNRRGNIRRRGRVYGDPSAVKGGADL